MRVLLYLSIALFNIITALAQEVPFVTLENFQETQGGYRSNVCDRQELVNQGSLELRNALRGLDLTVAMTNYGNTGWTEERFFSLSNEGTVPETDPGLYPLLLDELSERAGFRWRNSYAAIPPVTGIDNRTWTDLLEWEVQNFDIAVDYWAKSIHRMSRGVSFPHGWYDGNIVLVRSNPALAANNMNLWAFLDPFSLQVWVAIFASIVITGLVYFILERLNHSADERQLEDKPVASIFLAALTFTGHFEYRPDTNAARILSFSWSFWALVIMSAYTANMGAFLLSSNKASLNSVKTVDEALSRRIPICVQRGAVLDETLSERYPQLILVRKDSMAELFDGLKKSWYGGQGGCGLLLTNLATLQLYQSNIESNGDCSLETDKRVVMNLPAGFAVAVDAGVMCTSLVSYVLDLHFQEMRSDGVIDGIWNDYVTKFATIDCSGVKTQELSETTALKAGDIGGIFLVHGFLSVVALGIALFQYFQTKRNEPTRPLRPLFTSARTLDTAALTSRAEVLQKINAELKDGGSATNGDQGIHRRITDEVADR